MRAILKNPFTYLLIGIIMILIVVFGNNEDVQGAPTQSGVWTANKNKQVAEKVYIPRGESTEFILDIVAVHNRLGLSFSTILATSQGIVEVSSVAQYLATTQRLLGTDIIQYLENSPNRQVALDSLLAQLTYYIATGQEYVEDLTKNISDNTALADDCLANKEKGDTMFYQGIREGDEIVMQQGIEMSEKGAACNASKRVIINAGRVQLQRVEGSLSAMSTLSGILSQNTDPILNNFQLFKSNSLEQLVSIRNQLRRSGNIQ